MIRIEALQLRQIAVNVLRELGVEDTAELMDIRELLDGTWMVGFADHSPDTRFPGFDVAVQQEWSPVEAASALRLELREKLWICPLCQRRSQIRRIIDREVFRVQCDSCGRFEIEHSLLDRFRHAFETHDDGIVPQLEHLSRVTSRGARVIFLSEQHWRAIAAAARTD
jgi:hypothetical protein